MSKEEDLKKYLYQNAGLIKDIHKNPDWKYQSYEELILDCGLAMKGKPRSSDIYLGLPKSCYYNCVIKKRSQTESTITFPFPSPL